VLRLEGLTKLLDLVSRPGLQRREVKADGGPQEDFQTSVPKRLDYRTWKAEDLGNRKRTEERRCLGNVVNALHEVQITPSCMEDCQCSQGAV
jgi:hypothetical protein